MANGSGPEDNTIFKEGMRIVHLSYAHITDYDDPEKWLDKLDFYTGIPEAMASDATIKSIHCISYDGIMQRNGVEYHFLNLKDWQLYDPLTMSGYVKRLNPDVVIVHGLIFPLQILFLKLQLNNEVKIVVQHHAERPLTNALRFIQPWTDRYIDAYLFCSTDLADQWIDRGLISDKSKVYEVMEASSPFTTTNKDVALKKSQVSGNKVFLWVGGLHDRKDPLLMVSAFARFAKSTPGSRLYMIHQSSELIQEVGRVIQIEGVSDSIVLVGNVLHHDLAYWYNSADFIVSTSKYEGSGLAVCEGMSCGCIPILSDIPSFRMMTDNGRIGFLFSSGKIDALVSVLENSCDVDITKEKQKVLQRFTDALSFSAIADKMLKLFRSI